MYIKMFFKFCALFLFCIHVVVEVDDFFRALFIFPQSRLVVVCYRLCRFSMFIITSCLTNNRYNRYNLLTLKTVQYSTVIY
jgi:hypothetical protein